MESGTEFPDGWTVEVVERKGGGPSDKYWYSPDGEKFNSLVSVKRHLNMKKENEKNSTAKAQSEIKKKTKSRKQSKDKKTTSSSEETFDDDSISSDSRSELSKITYFPHSSESDVDEDLVFDIVEMNE